ncbi:histidine kinase [Microbacterium yannicii]|uniref:ATP-binding protein n=1 Tax=Microbacterium yannicii TaxID=671622 RepID=UPI001886D142|nr:histidine kinase [Microbacterium yannicii]MCO5951716.1 histidine kinase [Microbacterium yannicii]
MNTSAPARVPAKRRRPNPRTFAFGALALASVVLFSILVPVHIALYLQPAPLAFLFGATLCAAPVMAVWLPRWAIAVFVMSAVALPLPAAEAVAATWPWPWSVPAMLVLILLVGVLAIVHGWRLALVAWLLAIVGTLIVVIGLAGALPVVAGVVNLVIVTSVSGAALLVAVLVASRLRVGAELSRERELAASEQSRRVLVEERTRIARELHDVVAHGMSLIQVQASTARYRVPGLSDEARHEFDEIAQTAREGLTEMRRLLGILRTEDQQADLTPQQGLHDIPDLVQALRRAGAEIDASLAPAPESVPSAVDIAAFRIVQEALSNAVRHAPHTRVALSVEVDAAAVRVLVRNGPPDPAQPPAAPAPPASPATRGHGLLGMRERAALVGGELIAARDADGGWTVRALLPLAGIATDADTTPTTEGPQ